MQLLVLLDGPFVCLPLPRRYFVFMGMSRASRLWKSVGLLSCNAGNEAKGLRRLAMAKGPLSGEHLRRGGGARERKRERVGGEEWGTKSRCERQASELTTRLEALRHFNQRPAFEGFRLLCLFGFALACRSRVSKWLCPRLVFDFPCKRERSGLVDDRFVKTLITWRRPKA